MAHFFATSLQRRCSQEDSFNCSSAGRSPRSRDAPVPAATARRFFSHAHAPTTKAKETAPAPSSKPTRALRPGLRTLKLRFARVTLHPLLPVCKPWPLKPSCKFLSATTTFCRTRARARMAPSACLAMRISTRRKARRPPQRTSLNYRTTLSPTPKLSPLLFKSAPESSSPRNGTGTKPTPAAPGLPTQQ